METEKRDLLRQNYIQMLIASGVRGEEFASALAAIERVDRRLVTGDRVKSEVALEQRTQAHLRGWAASHKLDYEVLSEDEWQNQVQQPNYCSLLIPLPPSALFTSIRLGGS